MDSLTMTDSLTSTGANDSRCPGKIESLATTSCKNELCLPGLDYRQLAAKSRNILDFCSEVFLVGRGDSLGGTEESKYYT